jgi:uncharacterized repeat protein (TIGR01451 family)
VRRAGVGALLAGTVMLLIPVADGAPQADVNLGTAVNFAVLAGQSISSTSGGTIVGDVGVSPGSTFTPGTPAVSITGTVHLADAFSLQGQNDLTTAYNDAAGRTLPTLIGGGALGGLTLPPGLYRDDGAPASLGLTGALTLDAQGDPNAVWIFQSASSLIAESGSIVILTNGAQACHVFWQVTSSATLRTGSIFNGNILALSSITLETLATLDGRALARNGSVTLDNNTIRMAICAGLASSTNPPGFTVEKTLTNVYFYAGTTNERPPRVGEALDFEITIVNTSGVDLVTVPVQDTYDTNLLQYVSASIPSVDNINDGVINWTDVGPLLAGESTSLVVHFVAVGGTPNPSTAVNVALVSPTTETNTPPALPRLDDAPFEIGDAELGDTVWVDLNGNGLPDEDLAIQGLNGVTVRLYEIDGGVTNFVAQTVTATVGGLRGQYLFDGLPHRDFLVRVDKTTVPTTLPVNTTPLQLAGPLTSLDFFYEDDFGFLSASPTAVDLVDALAEVDGGRVLLSWATLMERDNAGFNVYRATAVGGPRTKVNTELIAGAGDGSGRSYTFADPAPVATGPSYYWIEDVEYDGTVRLHDPVLVMVGVETSSVEAIGSAILGGSGLYAITTDTFRRSGIEPLTVDSTRLRVYVDGSEVALYATTTLATLNDWDYALFYVEEGKTVTFGYEEGDPLRMPFRFVFPEHGEGKVAMERVPDEAAAVHVDLGQDVVRYLVSGFHETMIWLFDVTDAALPTLLVGADLIEVDAETGLYFSDTEAKDGRVYAAGASSVVEIDSIEP